MKCLAWAIYGLDANLKGGFCEEKWWALYRDAIVDPDVLD